MESDLIICDEYIKEVGESCKRRGEMLEEIMEIYIAILEEIQSEAIVEGEFSQSLWEFLQCVCRLRNLLQDISDNVNEACKFFVIDINDADSFLF